MGAAARYLKTVFRPLWVRMLAVSMVLAWAAVEGTFGHPGWAAGFGIMGLWLAYRFLIVYDDTRDD